ncbi:hypothetical protein VNO78_16459 [Psophocarpus tetragonolobus]|uniref:Uncharacterized protein n=1 Tax=Psophocarpus tetragonolobus TaxID=3891 RepID=A0AAN9SGR4_PSOTE
MGLGLGADTGGGSKVGSDVGSDMGLGGVEAMLASIALADAAVCTGQILPCTTRKPIEELRLSRGLDLNLLSMTVMKKAYSQERPLITNRHDLLDVTTEIVITKHLRSQF